MKKIYSVILLAGIMLSLAITNAEAQRFTKRKSYSSIGLHLNAMNYFGDIVPEPDFTSLRLASTRPNIGISYTRRFTPRISARGMFAWGRITGDDAESASADESENKGRYKRNLRFRNDIKELSAVATIDLFENRGTFQKRPDFSPYAFVGVAVFAHNPKAEYKGTFVELQPLGTEGQHAANASEKGYEDPYSLIQVSIPFGIGVKYKLDRYWDIGFEIGWRKTFTDYLDDVSGTYADKADLTDPLARALSDRSGEVGAAEIAEYKFEVASDPLAPETGKRIYGQGGYGDVRGDASDKDWYIVTGFSLSYIMPMKGRGPKFR